jgi:hypothetical protein
VIWSPFAALTLLSFLAALSRPGLPERDWPLSLFGLLVVVALPVALWLALRMKGAGAALVLALVGGAIPLLWAAQLRPDYSEPLHLITPVTVVGALAMVLGGLVRSRTRQEPVGGGAGR